MVVKRIISCPCPRPERLGKTRLLSIIIPAHNAENTLSACLSAIRDQEISSNLYEIIVIDDASNDHTCSIAEKFNVQLISLQQNLGAARARNYAADLARCEYLFFLDADVVLLRNSLTALFDLLIVEEPDAVVGSYTSLTSEPGFFSKFQNLYTFFNHDQPPGPISWFWTAMGAIKHNVFIEMGGFSTRYRGASAEDMDLGYRLADANKRILLAPQLRGEHRHHHSACSIIRNDYTKAAAWGELYLHINRDGKYHHTFTGRGNQITLFGVWLIPIFLFGGILWYGFWWLALLIFLLVTFINLKFYGFVNRKMGFGFAIRAMFFHLFTFFPAGLGSAKALYRFLFKKEF